MELASLDNLPTPPPASSRLIALRGVIDECLKSRKPIQCDGDFDPEIFEEICRSGVPCLFDNVTRKQGLPWNPQYFVQEHGEKVVRLIDCVTHEELPKKYTVREFFEFYAAQTSEGGPSYKLKVRVLLIVLGML